ncbi:hypothetical protein [Geoglobus acetivorans]|uniref:PD(D/E)XK endonuclease domain-containing protein n=1 Tax=Geoglobus acetivorans TaxID=565033 RepID=A0ABZ3H387_GEOAI|nr:hypothetical protein [Geoglobus acetivorans]
MTPVAIPIDEKFITDACYYAFKTVTCSFDNAMKPRFGNGGLIKHLIGKIGETAFFRFCLENGIAVKHAPFRNDYSEINGNDDFIISILGHDFRVEIKTATIRNPTNPDEKLVLFYNRDQYKAQEDHDYIVVFAGVNKEVTQIALLGWIHASEIRNFSIWTKNMKAPAYAIPQSRLKDMKKLADAEVWG